MQDATDRSFEARGGDWRIADRRVVLDYWRRYADSADWTAPVLGSEGMMQTRRCPGDPSYSLPAALFADNGGRRFPAMP